MTTTERLHVKRYLIRRPRVQLHNGLQRTKGKPTSVPTTRWQSSKCFIPLRVGRGAVGNYTEAGLPDPAVKYWKRAGALAASRWAYREATANFKHGLELLASLPDDRKRQ